MNSESTRKLGLVWRRPLPLFSCPACGQALTAAKTPDNELVIGSPSAIETMDPAQHMSIGSFKGENFVFNNIVAYRQNPPRSFPSSPNHGRYPRTGK